MITIENQKQFDALTGDHTFEVQDDSLTLKFDLVAPQITLKVGGHLKAFDLDVRDLSVVEDIDAFNIKATNISTKGNIYAQNIQAKRILRT